MKGLGRLISITRSRISRGPTHVAAAIFVMMAAFFVVTIFTFIFIQSRLALSYFESLPQVTAFLKDSASPEDVQLLRQEIENTGLTSSVKYVSKEEALEDYKKQNAADPALLELVTVDYTPASLQVQAKNVNDLDELAQLLNDKKGTTVDYVVYFSDVVNNLSKFTEGIRNTALLLLGLLILSLIITSSFITGLQTYIYRDEIEIMRLIGATKAFVYTPFIMESVFYGIIASIVSSAIAVASIPYVLSWFSDLFRGITAVQVSPVVYVYIVGASLAIGIFTNLIGAYIAVRKYARI